jgi:fructokinase
MFVVCGEALFDVFAGAPTPTGLALDARVGGSPFNLAVGLSRLGQPVSLLTTVSRGFLGERLMQALHSEGVGTGTVQRSDAPTTLSLVGTDAAGVPSYAFYGEGGADRELALPTTLPPGTRALCLGSYAAVVGESAQTLRALVERQRAHALIAYDPNIRLKVQPDLRAWREQIAWMLPRTDVLKVSDEDLALLGDRAPDGFAHSALDAGVSLVVVTRGERGAIAWTPTQCAAVAAPTVAVVDTVGAGDTFQAALLAWLAEHGALHGPALHALDAVSLAEAIAFAAQAAAITCARRGADLPTRAELARALGG